LRANLACQSHLLLATSALNLRTAFEIYANLLYIIRNPDPALMANRFLRFKEVEKYLYDKESGKPLLSAEEYRRIEEACNEWFVVKAGKARVKTHWTAQEPMSLKKMTKELDEWDEAAGVESKKRLKMHESYHQVYGMASKFTHGSSIIVNLYDQKSGIGCIPNPAHPTRLNLMGTTFIMKCLQEACLHFGVEFPEYDYAVAVMSFFTKAEEFARKAQFGN